MTDENYRRNVGPEDDIFCSECGYRIDECTCNGGRINSNINEDFDEDDGLVFDDDTDEMVG